MLLTETHAVSQLFLKLSFMIAFYYESLKISYSVPKEGRANHIMSHHGILKTCSFTNSTLKSNSLDLTHT